MACSILWLIRLGSAYHVPCTLQIQGLHEKDLDWKSYNVIFGILIHLAMFGISFEPNSPDLTLYVLGGA